MKKFVGFFLLITLVPAYIQAEDEPESAIEPVPVTESEDESDSSSIVGACELPEDSKRTKEDYLAVGRACMKSCDDDELFKNEFLCDVGKNICSCVKNEVPSDIPSDAKYIDPCFLSMQSWDNEAIIKSIAEECWKKCSKAGKTHATCDMQKNNCYCQA